MNVTEFRVVDIESRSAIHTRPMVRSLAAAMGLFFAASLCLAQSDLARLLPPEVPVIAGMHRLPHDQAKDTLWLATRNNGDDLSRLVALTDHDMDRRIDQVMVADWPSNANRLGDHLLIAQGQFRLASVISTRDSTIREKRSYENIPVLAIEIAGAPGPALRWLAMPRHDLVLFGTPSAVQLALDRFRSGAPADPGLLERLKKAHAADAAWSSVLLDSRLLQTREPLHTNDSFSACIARMREVDLAVHLGCTVTVDLQMDAGNASDQSVSGGTASEGTASRGTMPCVSDALFGSRTPEMRVSFSGDREPRVRVTMQRAQYDAWLDTFRTSRTRQLLEAMISGGAADSPADAIDALR